MEDKMSNASGSKTCVIIGASQAGVTAAFALRQEGWDGKIILLDSDPMLPYYRPPLSKAVLTGDEEINDHHLKPLSLYKKENIGLKLGMTVNSIQRKTKQLMLQDGSTLNYDKLILATGSRPIVPNIKGLEQAKHVFTLRSAADVKHISNALETSINKRVVIIGAGYVGLETAASLKKLGAKVTVIEREERVLARVTSPEMSTFFQDYHAKHGVDILTGKNVTAIETSDLSNKVSCSDNTTYQADIIIIGVGVRVNKELAEAAELEIENGIKVDKTSRTTDADIYAIGDCTSHYNPHYDRFIRLESIQNANDQAKVAAASICGKPTEYNSIPWFWSDQYDIKLQMVGLFAGYNEILIRKEDEKRFSVWYFKDDILLAVDAVNHTKSYVIGTKFIRGKHKMNKAKLVDPTIVFKPTNLLAE